MPNAGTVSGQEVQFVMSTPRQQQPRSMIIPHALSRVLLADVAKNSCPLADSLRVCGSDRLCAELISQSLAMRPAIQTHAAGLSDCRKITTPHPLASGRRATDLIAPSTLFDIVYQTLGVNRLPSLGRCWWREVPAPERLSTVLWTPPVFLGGGQLAHARR